MAQDYEDNVDAQVPKTATTDSAKLLEKRDSWHKYVSFTHPYRAGVRACADAEWEKRGQPKAEVRLQLTNTDFTQCSWFRATEIDIPIPPRLVFEGHDL